MTALCRSWLCAGYFSARSALETAPAFRSPANVRNRCGRRISPLPYSCESVLLFQTRAAPGRPFELGFGVIACLIQAKCGAFPAVRAPKELFVIRDNPATHDTSPDSQFLCTRMNFVYHVILPRVAPPKKRSVRSLQGEGDLSKKLILQVEVSKTGQPRSRRTGRRYVVVTSSPTFSSTSLRSEASSTSGQARINSRYFWSVQKR